MRTHHAGGTDQKKDRDGQKGGRDGSVATGMTPIISMRPHLKLHLSSIISNNYFPLLDFVNVMFVRSSFCLCVFLCLCERGSIDIIINRFKIHRWIDR